LYQAGIQNPVARPDNNAFGGCSKRPGRRRREGFARQTTGSPSADPTQIGIAQIVGRSVTTGGVRVALYLVPVGSGPDQLGVRKFPGAVTGSSLRSTPPIDGVEQPVHAGSEVASPAERQLING